VGTKFDYRVPASMALLRCFLGGVDGEPLLGQSDETLVQEILEELREKMGIRTKPVFWRVHRWPASMAQYTVGHQKRLTEIQARLEAIPGLHLAGNGYTGIGIPDCIRTGKQAAEAIALRADARSGFV
jgi:oxygen-dependent protoporphyrinogen oxidase